MCNKIDINEINRIPKNDFTIMLQNWMENEEVKKACEGQLRNNLIQQFLSKTALGNKMKKIHFDPKSQVMNSIEAEHLFCNKFYFTLSVFSMESEQKIPNFDQNERFRFEKQDIREFLNILGLMKDDAMVKHIINIYNSSDSQSLLSILIKQLISSHKKVAVECRTTSTQTDFIIQGAEEDDDNAKIVDLSQISCRSKSKKVKRKNHSLATPRIISTSVDYRRSKKSKGVSRITQSLDLMSQNINLITNKLEDFRKSSSHDDSKSIIVGTVGSIMQQLNGCVKNFERLCDDIKAINDTKLPKNYDEWIDDMKHSENGRKFLKKFTKSFTRILDEERAKIKNDYQRKFEKEKRKLARFHQVSSKKFNQPEESKISKDINEIYESTVLKLKCIEDENKIFEKSLQIGMDEKMSRSKEISKPESTRRRWKKSEDLDLNKCRQIHSKESKESSSINTNPHSYSSASFEDNKSEANI